MTLASAKRRESRGSGRGPFSLLDVGQQAGDKADERQERADVEDKLNARRIGLVTGLLPDIEQRKRTAA